MFRCVLTCFDKLGPKWMSVSSVGCISTENEGSNASVRFSKRLCLVFLLEYWKVFYDTGFRILKVSTSGARSWADGFRLVPALQSIRAFSLLVRPPHVTRTEGIAWTPKLEDSSSETTGLLGLDDLKWCGLPTWVSGQIQSRRSSKMR